jgi:hypothetical protein
VDAEGRWFANDELVRIDLDEAVQQYEESKLLYTQGKMTAEDWDTCQIKHMNGIAALRESLGNLQKERTALHKALNQNFDLTRHPNSPSRPSKTLPETGLKFSGLKISRLDGLGRSITRLQDCGTLQSIDWPPLRN